MTEDDGEWFTDPEHHWQASDLVKCVVSTALHSINRVRAIANLESETKKWSRIRKKF